MNDQSQRPPENDHPKAIWIEYVRPPQRHRYRVKTSGLFKVKTSGLFKLKTKAWLTQIHALLLIKDPQRIHRPPGSKMLSLVEFFCSKKTYSKVFEPIIADLHEEYFEALDKRRHWKMRWIRIRYTWAFFSAIGLNISLSTIKKIVDLWKVIG